MIPIDKYKKSLGDAGTKMTDKQILALRENQDKMAEIFFNMWLKKIRQKKQLVEV